MDDDEIECDQLGDAVEAALSDLGSTPEAVAGTLRSNGVRGNQSDPCGCPVARWLLKRVPGLNSAYVNADGAECRKRPGVSTDVMIPDELCNFLDRFDSGEFPDLIAPDADTLAIVRTFRV